MPREFLNLPENRTTRDQSQFLNELIERKAFSWTRVLENLEKVMPPRVHLDSISPATGRRQPTGAENDGRRRFARPRHRTGAAHGRIAAASRKPMITSERFPQSTTGDTEQFDIAAIYIPEPLTGVTPRQERARQTTGPRKTERKRAEAEAELKPKPAAPQGSSTNARPAANPEESENRAGGHGWRGSAGGRDLFFAAGGLGRIAPAWN